MRMNCTIVQELMDCPVHQKDFVQDFVWKQPQDLVFVIQENKIIQFEMLINV